MNESIQYIIRFLLGETVAGKYKSTIGYTADKRQYSKYSIVIHPSGFFNRETYGKEQSIPKFPLEQLEDIPLLFGEAAEEIVGNTLVLYADLVASAYFLITRYEEIVMRDVRDEHGRFPGKQSLPYRGGFLHRPVVDEYGLYLRNKLRELGVQLPEETEEIEKIYLTHDVDAPFYCRSWRNVLREIKNRRNVWKALKYKLGKVENDPFYTFPWLLEKDMALRTALPFERCKILFFFKAGGNTVQDKPVYSLADRGIKQLFQECSRKRVQTGLHSSYQAGQEPELIIKEKKALELALRKNIFMNRHHFLSCREPEHMDFLLDADIKEDFTMGYADVAGFRLGTCRAVRWINPTTRKLSSLELHPLTIMECSLYEKKYMGLSYEEALTYSRMLIKQVRKHRGELTLLWHNDTLSEGDGNYLRKLYDTLLKELANNVYKGKHNIYRL